MKVLIPEDINELGKQYLIDRGYKVVLGSGSDVETIQKEIIDADAVIARTAFYPREVIEKGNNLKIIARYGVGVDNIDVKAAENMGVYVTIGLGENVKSVAEHTMALILSCAKNIVLCDTEIKKGNWNIRNTNHGSEISGKTLGLIGVGAIGREIGKMAKYGFNMNVIGYDAYVKKEDFPEYITTVDSIEEIYSRSDYISLHIPLTEDTKNMFNREVFKKMKNTSYLINCSRGGIVNEDELYEALINKDIAGAALDVFENEPVDLDNKLLELNNFIASPHYAGMTKEATDGLSLSAAIAIDDVLNNRKPKYSINNPKK